MQDSLHQKPRQHIQTASRVFSGEAVIITPSENRVRLLNPTGTRIWELSDGSHTVAEIVDVLVAEFDVDPDHAQRTTLEMLDTLAGKDLIVWD